MLHSEDLTWSNCFFLKVITTWSDYLQILSALILTRIRNSGEYIHRTTDIDKIELLNLTTHFKTSPHLLANTLLITLPTTVTATNAVDTV